MDILWTNVIAFILSTQSVAAEKLPSCNELKSKLERLSDAKTEGLSRDALDRSQVKEAVKLLGEWPKPPPTEIDLLLKNLHQASKSTTVEVPWLLATGCATERMALAKRMLKTAGSTDSSASERSMIASSVRAMLKRPAGPTLLDTLINASILEQAHQANILKLNPADLEKIREIRKTARSIVKDVEPQVEGRDSIDAGNSKLNAAGSKLMVPSHVLANEIEIAKAFQKTLAEIASRARH